MMIENTALTSKYLELDEQHGKMHGFVTTAVRSLTTGDRIIPIWQKWFSACMSKGLQRMWNCFNGSVEKKDHVCVIGRSGRELPWDSHSV